MGLFKRRPRFVSSYKQAHFGEHRVCRDYKYDRRRRWKKILTLLGFCVAVVGIFYGLFFTPLLNIREIKIVRAENIYYPLKNSEIETWAREAGEGKWLWIISRQHRWFYPQGRVLEKIQAAVPVESLSCKISLLGKLIITVHDLYPSMTIQNAGQWYYLRADGTVIKIVEESVLDRNLPAVSFSRAALGLSSLEPLAVAPPLTTASSTASALTMDLTADNATSTTSTPEQTAQVPERALVTDDVETTTNAVAGAPESLTLDEILAKLDATRRDFVLDLTKRYPELILSDQIAQVEFIDAVLLDAFVKTKGGYRLYFDPQLDLDQQIKNFKLLKEQKLEGRKPDYIDLRYPDRLYYK